MAIAPPERIECVPISSVAKPRFASSIDLTVVWKTAIKLLLVNWDVFVLDAYEFIVDNSELWG